jgi:hypothetical protein
LPPQSAALAAAVAPLKVFQRRKKAAPVRARAGAHCRPLLRQCAIGAATALRLYTSAASACARTPCRRLHPHGATPACAAASRPLTRARLRLPRARCAAPQAAEAAPQFENAAPATPGASAAARGAAWLQASLSRRTSLADSASAESDADASAGASVLAALDDAADTAADAIDAPLAAVRDAVAASRRVGAEMGVRVRGAAGRGVAAAGRAAAAARASAAALTERSTYFAKLDEEKLLEDSPGSAATPTPAQQRRSRRSEEADDSDGNEDAEAMTTSPLRAGLNAIFAAAAARTFTATPVASSAPEASPAPAAASPAWASPLRWASPGGGGDGAASAAAAAASALTTTPARAAARTTAWVRALLSRRASAGAGAPTPVAAIAEAEEGAEDEGAEAAAAAPALSRESTPESDDAAVAPLMPSAAAAPAPAPPRPSLGLSRRASLGFAARQRGRSSVGAAGGRASLAGPAAGHRRSSILAPADADDGTPAPLPLPRGRRSSVNAPGGGGGGRASLAAGRPSLAPFVSIAEDAAGVGAEGGRLEEEHAEDDEDTASVVDAALEAAAAAAGADDADDAWQRGIAEEEEEDGDGDDDALFGYDAAALGALAEEDADGDVDADAPPLARTPQPAPTPPRRGSDALAAALRRASRRASAAIAAVAEEETEEQADESAYESCSDDVHSMSADSESATDPETAALSPLAALLRACGQVPEGVVPMADALAKWLQPDGGASAAPAPAAPKAKASKAKAAAAAAAAEGVVRKIGEGTYGEAFKCPGVVLKARRVCRMCAALRRVHFACGGALPVSHFCIPPLSALQIVPMGGEQLFNGAAQKEAEHMRAEAVRQRGCCTRRNACVARVRSHAHAAEQCTDAACRPLARPAPIRGGDAGHVAAAVAPARRPGARLRRQGTRAHAQSTHVAACTRSLPAPDCATLTHAFASMCHSTQAACFNATGGFVDTAACIVTRGPYAPSLLQARTRARRCMAWRLCARVC